MDATRRRRGRPFGRGPLAAAVLERAIVAAASVGSRLSARSAHRLAVLGGTAEWALRPRKRAVLAQNLARALGRPPSSGPVRTAVRAEIVNEARRSADFLWSVAAPDEVLRRCRVDGIEVLRDALRGGRGALLVGPHLAGWDVVVPLVRMLEGTKVAALVEDDWVAWAVAGVRRRANVRLIPASAPPRGAVSTLAAGGVVALLPDVVKPGMRTVEVTLLGERIRLPAGAGWLARISGAPVIVCSVLPIAPRAWCVSIVAAIPPPPRDSGRRGERHVMQAVADVWTPLLRRHPTQWAAVEPLPWAGGEALTA